MSNMRKNIPPGDRQVDTYSMADHTAKVMYWYATEWKAILMRARLAGVDPEAVQWWRGFDMWGAWIHKSVVLSRVEAAEKLAQLNH